MASIDAAIPDKAARSPTPPVKKVAEQTAPPASAPDEAPATGAAPPDMPAAPVDVEPAPVEEAPDVAPAPPDAVPTGPPVFSFVQPIMAVAESEVAARIVIRRSGDTSQRASIAWWTDAGSAAAVQDFADLGRRVERFEAGEVRRTIFVPLTNDAQDESLESFNVYLGRSTGRASEPLSGMRVDIVDDD